MGSLARAIVFDFDGLILESESPIFNSVGQVFQEHGVELTLDAWSRVIGGAGTGHDIYAHLEERIGRSVDREALREDVRSRHRAVVWSLPAQEGVEEYIAHAKERGLRLAVASSSSSEWVNGQLERLGLSRHFEAVLTRDDVERTKPAPDLYLAAIRRLGVASHEAIAIEDSPNGVTAAQAAGMFCLAVPNDITRAMQIDHADVIADSLASFPLASLLETHAQR